MTECEGRVVGIDGEYAVVDLPAGEGCGSCSRAGGCTTGAGPGRRQRIRNTVGARVGDAVIIVVPDGAVLKAALRAYIWPLLLALAGVALGLAAGDEAVGVVLGLAGLGAGWLMLRRQAAVRANDDLAPILRLKTSFIDFHGERP